MSNYTFEPNSDRVAQHEDLDLLGSPTADIFLLNLGKYIADGINKAFQIHLPEQIAIREIIDYDALNVDISRFPLLKLYRQTERFEIGHNWETKGVIAYCLSYPMQDSLPGLISYMAKAINIMLDRYMESHVHCQINVGKNDRSAEYRIMINQNTQAIHPFLRFNFTFGNLN